MPKLPSKKPPDVVELNKKQISTLLKFGKISKDDVFYDLGCARGKIVFYAHDKFHIKKSIGIEMNNVFYSILEKKLKKYPKNNRIQFIHGDFGYVDQNDYYMYDFSNATLVFNSLDQDIDESEFYKVQFKGKKTRIIKKDLPLIGYKPVAVNKKIDGFWFYLMKMPLSKYRIYSKKQWSRYVLQDEHATISKVYSYYDKQLRKRKINKNDRNESIKELRKTVKQLLPKK